MLVCDIGPVASPVHRRWSLEGVHANPRLVCVGSGWWCVYIDYYYYIQL